MQFQRSPFPKGTARNEFKGLGENDRCKIRDKSKTFHTKESLRFDVEIITQLEVQQISSHSAKEECLRRVCTPPNTHLHVALSFKDRKTT